MQSRSATLFVVNTDTYYYSNIMKRKYVITLSAITILVITIAYFFRAATRHDIEFQFLDGDTGSSIPNHQIYICDDSLKLKYLGEYPYSRFCDGEHRTIHKIVTTDSSGFLQLDLTKLDVRPPHNIIFDIGNSNDRWGIAKIGKSDSISHDYSFSHIRVLNSDRSGHVTSNLIYDLDTNEVREIFTSGSPEIIYPYDYVKIVIFKK